MLCSIGAPLKIKISFTPYVQLQFVKDEKNCRQCFRATEGMILPPLILCDKAFPLGAHLQKPYAHAASDKKEAMYNYNLPKSRRNVEHAFGK